jgi:hypothetical protein
MSGVNIAKPERNSSENAKIPNPIPSAVSNKFNAGKKKKGLKNWRGDPDSKVVGLKNYGLDKAAYEKRHQLQPPSSVDSRKSVASLATVQGGGGGEGKPRSSNRVHYFSVEENEVEVRRTATTNPLVLFYLGNLAALKVIFYYLSKYSELFCFPANIEFPSQEVLKVRTES